MVLVIIVIAALLEFHTYSLPENRLARALDLGQKYLEEMNYEQAIVAFDKAIEIDPKNTDAYLGKADVYVGLGNIEAAIAVLEEGYDLTQSDEILKRLEEVWGSGDGAAYTATGGNMTNETAEGESGLPYFELGFSPEDFTIAGYSIMDGNHLDDVEQAVAAVMPKTPEVGEFGNYIGWSYDRLHEGTLDFVYCGSESYTYADNHYVFYDENYVWMGIDTNNGELPVNEFPLFEGSLSIGFYDNIVSFISLAQGYLTIE